jgi:hypothetical protein
MLHQMNTKNESIYSYIKHSRAVFSLYIVMVSLFFIFCYTNIRNEKIFCFAIGLITSSIILYANIFIMLVFLQQLIVKKVTLVSSAIIVLLSFLLSTLVVTFIVINYQRLLFGVLVGLAIPVIIIFFDYILY